MNVQKEDTELALRIANKVLEVPYSDPDRDEAVLARQLLRMHERETKLREHVRELKLRAGRHRLAIHALGQIKDGKTLFEHSPTKDQECFEAWQELNDSGVALDQFVTFPIAGILQT